LIPELSRHGYPGSWLNELTLGLEMSAFSGLNLDEPRVSYPQKYSFSGNVVYLSRLAYSGVLVSWLRATNFPRVGIDLVACGSLWFFIWADMSKFIPNIMEME
jgi:hypothetical protein